jgi:hypothetical protein
VDRPICKDDLGRGHKDDGGAFTPFAQPQTLEGAMTNLRAVVLAVLERHDGCCLDNSDERDHLASELTRALATELYLVVTAEGDMISDASAWCSKQMADL